MATITEIGKKALRIIKDNAGIDLATLLTILATGAVAGAELISDLKKEKLLDDEDDLKVSKEGEEEIKEVKSEFFVKYKYFGIRDKETNRPFCARLLELNRVYTREDINTLSERLGYNVWMRRGGWYHNPDTGVNTPYCRHTWRQVIVKRKTQKFAGFNPNQKRNPDGKWGSGGVVPLEDRPCFKEWNKGNKIVDENGNPIKVFHGSPNVINAFNPDKTGQGVDQLGSGFYFTNDKEEAKGYSQGTDNVVNAYLSIKKPIIATGANLNNTIDMTSDEAYKILKQSPLIYGEDSPLQNWYSEWWEGGTQDWMIRKLAESYNGANIFAMNNDFFDGEDTAFRKALHEVLGFDGIIQDFQGNADGRVHYIAWFPNQIKSVDAESFCHESNINLAGFDPSQKRNEDGTWGDGGESTNTEGELEKEFPKLTIDVYQNDKKGVLTLSRVIVPEDLRGEGIGTEFMESLIEKADKLGYSIILTPSDDFGGNKNRLIEFYKRFGFVLNKGANRDFSHREEMYRLPKK